MPSTAGTPSRISATSQRAPSRALTSRTTSVLVSGSVTRIQGAVCAVLVAEQEVEAVVFDVQHVAGLLAAVCHEDAGIAAPVPPVDHYSE